MQRTKLLLPAAAWPVVLWLLFAGTYAGVFLAQRAAYIEGYGYAVSRIPSVMLYGSDTAKLLEGYGTAYGAFVGLGIGLVYLVLAYALLGIFALVRLTRLKFGAMLAFLLAALPIDALAYLIRYQPRPRTAISSALAYFVGFPLWSAAVCLTAILVILFILSFVYGQPAPTSEKNA